MMFVVELIFASYIAGSSQVPPYIGSHATLQIRRAFHSFVG